VLIAFLAVIEGWGSDNAQPDVIRLTMERSLSTMQLSCLANPHDVPCAINPHHTASGWQTRAARTMTSNSRKIRGFRKHIPSFECRPGCHDCCGPVTTSTDEMARLPCKSVPEHEAALADLNCPYLGNNGCEVYAERPLICRLFGTSPRIACPNGNRPDVMIDPKIEQQIHRFFMNTRHVLV